MADDRSLVRVLRNGLQESEHELHVAVADERGRLVAHAGDPRRSVFARSSMKPLQAAVSLSLLGGPLDDRQVAIMCASHNGENEHVRAVRSLLATAGLDASALRNTPGWPLDREAAARAGRPDRLHQNCSGKHAGMLVASASAGWRLETYLRPRHPLQTRVTKAVLSATGLDRVDLGVDGCGVPVHGMPLRSIATLYARLSRPARLGEMAPHVATATAAMLANPYLVAGRRREDTAIMQAVPGLIVKSGAEALICASDAASGLGVSVKVADGGDRACAPALLKVLELIGLASSRQIRELGRFARPWVTGGGRRAGELVADVRLLTR